MMKALVDEMSKHGEEFSPLLDLLITPIFLYNYIPPKTTSIHRQRMEVTLRFTPISVELSMT